MTLVNSEQGLTDLVTFKTTDLVGVIVKYIKKKYSIGDSPVTMYIVNPKGENEPLVAEDKIGVKLNNGDTVFWTSEQVWGKGSKRASTALATFGRHAVMLRTVYKDWNFEDFNVPARGVYKYCKRLGGNTKHRVLILPSASYPTSPPSVFVDPKIDHPCCRADGTIHIHGEDSNIVWRRIKKADNPLVALVVALREQFKLW